ncbi:hypothetical protein KAOT1_13662 [Kordia algicida OT-1]|uniref:Pentapeptide repeat-containing protein n=1 Tax=Kordia algicida OT-1 TaxID=391587 RepID=A9DK72_9FLAO|nr:hypothetical protein KAOT1_13662 [Kordia algicida OT-1]
MKNQKLIRKKYYKWVKKLLREDVKEISDEEYVELEEEYFQKDKSDWFKVKKDSDQKEIQVWDNKRVKVFWMLIRKFSMKRGQKEGKYSFSKFIFPKFEWFFDNSVDYLDDLNNLTLLQLEFSKPANFWNEDEKIEFSLEVNFSQAKFLSIAIFSQVTFYERVSFSGAKFLNSIYFNYTIFYENVSFNSVSFYGDTFFRFAKFEKQVSFGNSKFCSKTFFVGATFSLILDFYKVTFLGDTYFENLKLTNEVNFSFSNFTKEKVFLFNNIEGIYSLNFSNVLPNSEIVFRKVNFINSDILNSDISKFRFEECNWGSSQKIKMKNGNESIYRQLKKNFVNARDWDLAGKAYRSEMSTKKNNVFRKPVKRDKNISSWIYLLIRPVGFIIYFFYGFFSGYNQSIIKPIFWFLIFTFLIFPFIYSDFCFNCIFREEFIEQSVKNAFPFFSLDDSLSFWYSLIQKIFSTVLLTFFILGLRNKFKQ